MNRQQRRHYAKHNAKRPAALTEVPRSQWPYHPDALKRIWSSRTFHVQLWEDNGFDRLSICRTEVQDDWEWGDGIAWDELQRIKAEIGYGDWWAVECYPPQAELVNVSNMRHLFLLPEPPAFGWRQRGSANG